MLVRPRLPVGQTGGRNGPPGNREEHEGSETLLCLEDSTTLLETSPVPDRIQEFRERREPWTKGTDGEVPLPLPRVVNPDN